MKIRLLFLFCCLTTIISCKKQNQQIVQEYFDYGNIESRLYTNNYFGFQISIPENYRATYKQYDFHQRTLIEKDTIPLIPRLASSIETAQLLFLEPPLAEIGIDEAFNMPKTTPSPFKSKKHDSIKRDFFGADYQLNINVFKLPFNEGYTYNEIFYNMDIPDNVEEREITISGVDFNVYQGIDEQRNFMLGTRKKNVLSYTTVIKGYSLNIDLFYETEEQKCMLLEILKSFQFCDVLEEERKFKAPNPDLKEVTLPNE
ncbi:MAG: hypothetical protein AAFY00_04405 [Bacteroidota bacterium]